MVIEDIIQNTEEDYKNLLGNPLMAAILNKDSQETIVKAKKEFYDKLYQFRRSNYKETQKINEHSLLEFYQFYNQDWSSDEVLNKVKGYFDSLSEYKT